MYCGSIFRPRQAGVVGRLALSALFGLLAIPGCDDDGSGGTTVTVRGTITNSAGSQKILGGQGTVSSAASVTGHAVAADGSLTLLAQADVSPTGSYEIEVPAEVTALVLQCRDEAGDTLASVIVEATGTAGGQVDASPMDTETSVEAEVYRAMIAAGLAASSIDVIDLRARIDEDTAGAVRAALEATGDAEAEIQALAEACAAAQAAEIQSYARAWVTTSQQALFAAELGAAQTLNTALHAGESADAAYQTFWTDLAAAAESVGCTTEDQAHAESAAGLSFRLTVDGRLLGTGDAADAVVDAALCSAADLEARTSARAIETAFAAADATADIAAAARDATATLLADVAATADAGAAAQAYEDFSAALIGDTSVTGSILGDQLQVNAGTAVAVDTAIAAATAAAENLDTAARTAVTTALEASTFADPGDIARAAVTTWSNYRAAVDTAVADNPLVFADQAELSSAVMLEANGSFRASSR